MKNLFVSDLQNDSTISGVPFAVVEVKSATDKNNNPYYDLVLADKTGQVAGKVWSDNIGNVDKQALKAGRIVAVDAVVADFRGKLQLNITAARAVDETKLESYMETSVFDAEDMLDELKQIIDTKISNKEIKQLFANLFADADAVEKLKTWPAAVSFHHDFRSGLLQHILECLSLADGLERFYPDADFDLVRAGIILHDIGKLEELDASSITPRYTVKGSVLGHVYIGCEFVDRYLPGDASEKLNLNLK
ncbi:HD domain-containing protein, partial [Candidatus Dojkabacteria bacterium]|nr:HD domain-containing protein [Candidatus Dojkabacteria bacterium]